MDQKYVLNYGGAPNLRKLGRSRIEKMVKMIVIEPAQTFQDLLKGFAKKEFGIARFYIDLRKLFTIARGVAFPIL